ncbi:MAG: hypothetical protein WC322_05735 [Candidatus Paceibacterota bacterium]|jgi:hypothetical protein
MITTIVPLTIQASTFEKLEDLANGGPVPISLSQTLRGIINDYEDVALLGPGPNTRRSSFSLEPGDVQILDAIKDRSGLKSRNQTAELLIDYAYAVAKKTPKAAPTLHGPAEGTEGSV